MAKHLQRDLENLKKELLGLGSMVEQATNRAISAFLDRRTDSIQEVLEGDRRIDEMEVAIEEECLKILALHQPVARDLRFIITVLKVNNDLERVGDYAVNIAERSQFLARQEPIPTPVDFREMARTTSEMMREGLDSLVNLDTGTAHAVLARDSQVDRIHKRMHVALRKLMVEDREAIERAISTLSVSRYLERIADLATNIAEDVIFLVDGEVVRHQPPPGEPEESDA